MLIVQSNLASTYEKLGHFDKSLRMRRDIYPGTLRLFGEEHENSLIEANNYAVSLENLKRFKEAKSLLCKTVPVAQRLLGEGHDLTLNMKKIYARTLCRDPAATLDDLREAVTMLEETERIARRVLGSAHPEIVLIEKYRREARAALRAREETQSSPGSG